MSRARATALTLVNWKGVFFEHYWLDRHVTALEGANGAGKTTVMIAAYVVLLPDLTRLRFVNLGETGPSGGDRGIWGRLGDAGPSFAAIEVDPGDGQRLLLGVYLERKAAPSLALTPFLISGLGPTDSVQRLFIDDHGSHEQVSALPELERKAKAAGYAVDIFASSKDYFASLFERGINPLRLGSDEERNKWNEMLKTSMTGGISRTLTSDLRSFLFKQESGLLGTLSRMRENLEACRRTRVEVSEARVLEREVRGVGVAGQALFEAVMDASREQAREARERRERAEQRHSTELAHVHEQQTRLAEAELRQQGLAPRIQRARSAESQARQHLSEVERALVTAARLTRLEEERRRLQPEAEAALEHKSNASSERQRAKTERDAAQQTLLSAANGLGSLQAGLEELHRQAHAHRRLREELGRAHAELGRYLADSCPSARAEAPTGLATIHAALERMLQAAPGVPSAPEGEPSRASDDGPTAWARAARSVIRTTLSDLDRARAERDRDAELAERRRAAQAEARAALAFLTGRAAPGDLRARAELELARLAELELSAKRLSELRADCQRHTALAERQRALRAELTALGLPALEAAGDFIAHLNLLEASLHEAERARREHELAAERAASIEERARERSLTLEGRCDVYRQLAQCVARLQQRGAPPPETRGDLRAALRQNDEARHVLMSRAAELAAESQSALARSLECEAALAGSTPMAASLAELCDGQLLRERYDDLDAEAARRVQAELGPLANAIVVRDPEHAAAQIMEHIDGSGDVWLLRAGAALPSAATLALPIPATDSAQPERATAPYVVVDVGYGLRLSPLPKEASLGRAARRRQGEALRAEAEAARRSSDELGVRERDERAARGDLEALQEHWELWTGGDPHAELERVRAELALARDAGAEAHRLGRQQRIEAARLGAQRDGLRAQLSHHHLLDPPDYAAEATAARTALARAETAAAELARAASARSVLLARIHDLEASLPDATALPWPLERARLDDLRDRLFVVEEALALIESSGPAWAWQRAESALAERAALVPELEAQQVRTELELTRVQLALDTAERAWEAATERAQSASAALSAIEAHVTRAQAELSDQGVTNPDTLSLEHASAEVERHAASCAELGRSESSFEAELALCRERAAEAAKRAAGAERELGLERSRELPAARQWQELAEAARQAGALDLDRPADAHGVDITAGGRLERAPSAEHWLAARAKCELLADRLARARGGAELAEAVRVALSNDAELAAHEARGSRYLRLWLEVKAWLARRLPTALSNLGEPMIALERLGTDLAELELRLERQEGELRGTSGDVARSIDVQLRRASTQVRRLNRSLDGVRFGSIHAIRVQMDRIDKMERVLAALRDGQTQELLFQSNLPIEAALDEIFKRHAGGRTGGQRLLDFREYLELSVQIQRRPDQSWERVSASQVSTGEAIGIGAALMMVILTEWERDELLLRRPRDHGSLRFLFLDEANRLSQDNLGVLFDLCQNLDLQLLIAAPEVARAEGNTTYRLVRRTSEDGREEVLVTGRRASLPEPAAQPLVPEPPRAEQVSLFGE